VGHLARLDAAAFKEGVEVLAPDPDRELERRELAV